MDIITRKEAKARGLTRYFTGEPCKHGHAAERYTQDGNCAVCKRSSYKDWLAANPDKMKEIKAKNYAENADACRAYSLQWWRENRERVRENKRRWNKKHAVKHREEARRWREENPERFRQNSRRWERNNRHYTRAKWAARHALKLKATPSWLTEEHKAEIAYIYEQAVLAEKLTGVKHHVDHVEPLRGEDRCGLHVPWNLQILTAEENRSKGNRPIRHFHWKKL